MKPCTYTRTATGICHQFAQHDEECYYHEKVLAGLIEPTDESELMRGFQTIRNS